VDPGRSAAGILFLILGFRAASKIKPGKIILGAGLSCTNNFSVDNVAS
jgi:hypothetical protein